MIGGGQLSRMAHQASIGLGIGFSVLADTNNDSAAQVVESVFLGSHIDEAAIRAAAAHADVVTFDHEHVPLEILRRLEADGVTVWPSSDALQYAQDKSLMRARLADIGAPQPRWSVVETVADLEEFAAGQWPVVLKVSRGGYDGRGVWVCHTPAEAAAVMGHELAPGVVWLAEECVAFQRELSAQIARSPQGQIVAYPIVETVQTNGMCAEVIAPAPHLDDERALAAQQTAMNIAYELGVVGMLAVELFDTGTEILVNELAMRPHNSGHWTMDGAVTSQFENHLRAVLDLPLGDPSSRAEWNVMVNVIGGDFPDMYAAYKHIMARDPGVKVHMYGKEVRVGRKIGHVNVASADLNDALRRARHAAGYLTGTIEE